jgi:hypothetical protein
MRVRTSDRETVYGKLISKLFYCSTKEQEVLGSTNRLLHFHYRLHILYKKDSRLAVYNLSGCNVGILDDGDL